MTNIKERILQFAKYKGITLEKFFNGIGMTYGSFRGDAKKRPLNSDALAKIINEFPEINPVWLLTGKGEMLKQNQTETNESEVISILKKQVEEQSKTINSLLKQIEQLTEGFTKMSQGSDKIADNEKIVEEK